MYPPVHCFRSELCFSPLVGGVKCTGLSEPLEGASSLPCVPHFTLSTFVYKDLMSHLGPMSHLKEGHIKMSGCRTVFLQCNNNIKNQWTKTESKFH